jgi:hypothetical protein
MRAATGQGVTSPPGKPSQVNLGAQALIELGASWVDFTAKCSQFSQVELEVTDCLILDPKGGGPASYTFGGFFATEGLDRSLSSDRPRPAPSLQLSSTWLTCTSPSISTKMRPTHNSFDSFHIALSCIPGGQPGLRTLGILGR